jgi:hypothetical protein
MKKYFLSLILFTFCFLGFSQSGTSSPYSFYGVGINTFKGSIDNRSMGGLSLYTDSIHLNLTNPASYSQLRRTNYSLGITYDSTSLKSDLANETSTSANVNYLAVGIPTNKFTFGFGIIPQTSVGYLLESSDKESIPNTIDRYNGEGGLNTAFLTLGFKMFKKIGVGVTANYEFGNLRHSTTRFLENIEKASRIESNSSLSGINFVYSLLLREKISDKLTLHASFIQSPEFKLGSNNTQTISTFSTSANSTLDQISVDLASLDLEKTEITVTQKQTFGLGIGQDTKWFFGAEYMKSNGGGLKNQLFNLNNVDYKNGSRISIGGFYIPEFDSFTNYFNTIVYRLGIRIEKTGLYIQDQSIDEIGFNFGLGLPFQGFSNVNLGFEIGKRGSQNEGLLEENFFSVRLGMSLSDLWFVKNKYN